MKTRARNIFNNTKTAILEISNNTIESLTYLIPILIGIISFVCGIIGYIKFIVDGGYSAQVNATKEYGIFGGYEKKFTTGSAGSISTGVIGKILLILIAIEIVFLLIKYFRVTQRIKRIVMIVDLLFIIFESVLIMTEFGKSIGFLALSGETSYKNINIKTFVITYLVTAAVSFVLFFALVLLTKECRWIVRNTVISVVIAFIVMPLIILLIENIIPLATGGLVIVIVFAVVKGAIYSATSDDSGSSSNSVNYSEPSQNSKPIAKVEDNRPLWETDKNPNHHYIVDYSSYGGINLYKVHGSLGDYIELDNHIVTKRICSLEEAKSGKHMFFKRDNGEQIKFENIPWKTN